MLKVSSPGDFLEIMCQDILSLMHWNQCLNSKALELLTLVTFENCSDSETAEMLSKAAQENNIFLIGG
jgi:hypothetical protein